MAEKALTELDGFATQTQLDRETVRLYMENAAEAIPSVVNRLRDVNIAPISLTLTQPTLDDVFLQVTGQRLRAEAQPAGALAADGEREKRGR